MSIPFSRSTRSLVLDNFRPAIIGLILAILTLIALILWFFLARVTLYQSSSSASLQSDGQILASFKSEVFPQIKQGQQGVLRLGQAGEQRPLTVPIMVFDTQAGNEQVILIPTDASMLPAEIANGMEGRADIETEYISPAELLLRAAGKFLSGRRIPASPQATPASGTP